MDLIGGIGGIGGKQNFSRYFPRMLVTENVLWVFRGGLVALEWLPRLILPITGLFTAQGQMASHKGTMTAVEKLSFRKLVKKCCY